MLSTIPHILFHINSGCLEPSQTLAFASLPSVGSYLQPFPIINVTEVKRLQLSSSFSSESDYGDP